ncbi:SDR family NAD(P)-dependent oxidoreductase [soil metagenome]
MAKTVFITGASSGFGAATVRRFTAEGYHVFGTARREDRLQALAEEVGADKFSYAVFDIRDKAALDAALAALPEEFAGIDVLINNAGLALGTGPAQSANLDDWQTMIDTNISSLVAVTQKLLPAVIARKGVVINISSTASTYPYPGGNVYGGTKAFVRQFSLGLRSDLHGTGVRVASIEPGMVETEFTVIRTGGNQAASDALYAGSNPLTAEDIADSIYWVSTLPAHMNVNRLELMPVSQSWAPFQVARES